MRKSPRQSPSCPGTCCGLCWVGDSAYIAVAPQTQWPNSIYKYHEKLNDPRPSYKSTRKVRMNVEKVPIFTMNTNAPPPKRAQPPQKRSPLTFEHSRNVTHSDICKELRKMEMCWVLQAHFQPPTRVPVRTRLVTCVLVSKIWAKPLIRLVDRKDARTKK